MTEREALRLLHLDEHFSKEQLRHAYRDLVKVWHPDRFQSDEQLRTRAERTLQSINDAYALLQDKAASPTSASAPVWQDKPEDTADVPPSPRAKRFGRPLVAAVVIGATAGAALALSAVFREDAVPPSTLSAADVELSVAPRRNAGGDSVGAARPESGADLLTAGGRGTGQVATRNATTRDAAVLLDGPSGARGFFVRRGEQVTLLDVVPGTYRVRVVFGAAWTGRAFAKATFFEREEPTSVVSRSYYPDPRPSVIVLDDHSGMRPTAASPLE